MGLVRRRPVALAIATLIGVPLVWKELMKVRYGQTTTYRLLATTLGSPGAAQAVGRANGDNPLPIVIPCHRVLGSDEGLCGYAAGIKTKEFHLRLEGALLL